MGYHCSLLVRLARLEPMPRSCAGRPSLPNMRGPVVSEGTPGRRPRSPDGGPARHRRGEPMPEEYASERFEDRHHGAASLGIP
jgi:hypothetical protein